MHNQEAIFGSIPNAAAAAAAAAATPPFCGSHEGYGCSYCSSHSLMELLSSKCWVKWAVPCGGAGGGAL